VFTQLEIFVPEPCGNFGVPSMTMNIHADCVGDECKTYEDVHVDVQLQRARHLTCCTDGNTEKKK
jgi:hypothetical protein